MRFLKPVPRNRAPIGARRQYRYPELREVIALALEANHYKAWRIVNVNPRDDGRTTYHLRPAHMDPDPNVATDADIHGSLDNTPSIYVLPEDYPVSVKTGEIMPTKETLDAWDEEDRTREHNAFNMPMGCPACGELITQRQHRETFDRNLVVPDGPPVTFHVRAKCWAIGGEYKKAIAEENRALEAFTADADTFDWEGGANGPAGED